MITEFYEKWKGEFKKNLESEKILITKIKIQKCLNFLIVYS